MLQKQRRFAGAYWNTQISPRWNARDLFLYASPRSERELDRNGEHASSLSDERNPARVKGVRGIPSMEQAETYKKKTLQKEIERDRKKSEQRGREKQADLFVLLRYFWLTLKEREGQLFSLATSALFPFAVGRLTRAHMPQLRTCPHHEWASWCGASWLAARRYPCRRLCINVEEVCMMNEVNGRGGGIVKKK